MGPVISHARASELLVSSRSRFLSSLFREESRVVCGAFVPMPSTRIPMMRQLLDVVGETVELPLPVYFAPAPQRESVQPLVVSEVAEYRLHRGEAPRDHLPADGRIDPHLHPFDAVEYATLEWVDWYNNRRLLTPIGDIPPAERELAYHRQQGESAMAA
jgi:transposase InsO family protein